MIKFNDQLDEKGNPYYHIPYLMLLGLMYCSGNPAVKVKKFFELCQNELNA
jgi:hypothetical protein